MDKKNQSFNLVTFFALYIAQTIPMSFFSTVIPVLMRQESFSLSSIALLQLLKLPWIVKFFWAPLIDRTCCSLNSYKRWIFSSELIYAAIIFVVSFLDFKVDFYTIIPLLLASFVASATQDIATDALAVISFSKRDKSLVNSMQSMGSFAGSMVGAGLLMVVYNMLGWNKLLPFLALFVLIALLPLKMNSSLALISTNEKKTRAKWGDFIYFFGQKGIWRQVGFLSLCYSGIIGILTILKPYLVDLGYDIKEIGFISGIVGTSMGVVTAWFGGVIIRKIGISKSRIIFAIVTIFTTLLILFINFVTPTTPLVYLMVVSLWGCYGLSMVVVYTSSMNSVREGREGTDFTIQTVVTHFSSMVLAVMSGKIADLWGYQSLFIVAVIFSVVYLIYVLNVSEFIKSDDCKKL